MWLGDREFVRLCVRLWGTLESEAKQEQQSYRDLSLGSWWAGTNERVRQDLESTLQFQWQLIGLWSQLFLGIKYVGSCLYVKYTSVKWLFRKNFDEKQVLIGFRWRDAVLTSQFILMSGCFFYNVKAQTKKKPFNVVCRSSKLKF